MWKIPSPFVGQEGARLISRVVHLTQVRWVGLERTVFQADGESTWETIATRAANNILLPEKNKIGLH